MHEKTAEGIVGVVPPILMLSLKFLSGDPMKWKYEAGSFVHRLLSSCLRSQGTRGKREGERDAARGSERRCTSLVLEAIKQKRRHCGSSRNPPPGLITTSCNTLARASRVLEGHSPQKHSLVLSCSKNSACRIKTQRKIYNTSCQKMHSEHLVCILWFLDTLLV